MDLKSLYQRDLNRLIENLEVIPEVKLWEVPEGVTNSCGILTQHLIGNLNHFIGKGLGNIDYVRKRDREFTKTNVSKKQLLKDIDELKNTLEVVFNAIEDDELKDDYPIDAPYEATVQTILIHLYGHLNYHLGQINYLRRILSKNG